MKLHKNKIINNYQNKIKCNFNKKMIKIKIILYKIIILMHKNCNNLSKN